MAETQPPSGPIESEDENIIESIPTPEVISFSNFEGPTVVEPTHRERTAGRLAGYFLLIFGLTVIPPILAGLAYWHGLPQDLTKFVETLASIEIGPLGVVFGFYFSEHGRKS